MTQASVRERPTVTAVPKAFEDGTTGIVLDPEAIRRPVEFCSTQKLRGALEIS